jgi:hypothetical protein
LVTTSLYSTSSSFERLVNGTPGQVAQNASRHENLISRRRRSNRA